MKLSRILLVGAVAFVVVASTCCEVAVWKVYDAISSAGYLEDWSDADGELVEGIEYGPKSWNKFDLYLPKDFASNPPRGLVLAIHGGGWTTGARTDENWICRRLAKCGVVAATMDYALFNDKNPDVCPDYSTELVLDEIDAAIAKIKAETEARGLKFDRIATTGTSAGGHLSMLHAYSRGKTAPLPVAFVAPRVGPSDFHLDAWRPVLDENGVAGIVSASSRILLTPKDVLDGTPKAEEAIAKISPVAFVKAGGGLPTVAAYGGKDNLVVPQHREKLVAALEESKTPFDLVLFPNSGHMLEGDPDKSAEFLAKFDEYVDKYLKTDAN